MYTTNEVRYYQYQQYNNYIYNYLSDLILRIDFDWTMIPYTIREDILHVVDGDTLFHAWPQPRVLNCGIH